MNPKEAGGGMCGGEGWCINQEMNSVNWDHERRQSRSAFMSPVILLSGEMGPGS